MQKSTRNRGAAELNLAALTEDQYHSIDSMSGLVVVVAHDGKIICCNANWSEYTQSQSIFNADVNRQNNYFDIYRSLNGSNAHHAYQGIKSVLNGSLMCFDMDFICQLSQARFQMRVTPLLQAHHILAVVISHDEVMPEHHLPHHDAIAEKCYQALFDSLSDGVMVVDLPCGTIRQCNDAIANFTGYKLHELIGKTFWSITPDKWHDFERSLVIEDLSTKGYIEEFEKEYIRKDGALIPISLQCWPLLDNQGHLIAAWAIIKDLTDKKRREQQVQQTQKMQALGTLAGGIAHEFNNILAIILANTELLNSKLSEDADEKEYIDSVITATERASGLVNQILAFSRLDGFTLTPTELSGVVDSAVDIVTTNLPRQITMSRDVSREPVYALANDAQIQHIIFNLCTNAIQELGDNPGHIHIELHALQENMYGSPHLRLSISDTGRGIQLQDVSQIFEPFYTTKPAGKGSGLGLSVVQGIVNRHSGKIYVESSPDEGTKFHIDIPIFEDINTQENQSMDHSVEISDKHVLIVEENASLAQIYETYFRQLGCQVTICRDGTSALSLCKEKIASVDLIFTDESLSGISGSQFVSEIRSLCRQTPIAMVTNQQSAINIKIKNEIQHWFVKPVSRQNIRSCMSALLN